MKHIATITVSEIFFNAIKAVSPYRAVHFYCEDVNYLYKTGNFKDLLIIGFGKAVCPMANAIEDSLGEIRHIGTVITKYKHCDKYIPASMHVFEAGHPVPDDNGLNGTNEIIGLLKNSGKDTLVLCLISGGGSSLLVSPYAGVTLEEKQKTTRLLLNSGADIYELNTVRKHISKVKGGRLAEIAYPAKVISLILSDVIGDRIDVIASGPTSYDPTTYNNALDILKKYGLIDTCPRSILEVLYNGINGFISETPKKGNRVFEKVDNIIIGSNKKALEAACSYAGSLGLHAQILSSEISGEARDIGKWLSRKVIEIKDSRDQGFKKPLCLISGGETTVIVKGNGLGGRNMELALSFAMEIEGIDGITLLSAGTDGTDGPTDAAGAIVDGKTIKKAKALGLNPEAYLKNNDSYTFFKNTGGLFITGPTGTNVMDIQIVLIV